MCGASGNICCHAPEIAYNPTYGPLVYCDEGLGCDIITDQCVQPCGGAGQVCCDGSETRALKWTREGRVYSPTGFELIEMCDKGACDITSHRCFSCGATVGSACCPPDASQATQRCVGNNIMCQFETGICIQCGNRGNPPCDTACDSGLELRNKLCDICGTDLQPPCDSEYSCENGCGAGLKIAKGLCQHCGSNLQIPCDAIILPDCKIYQGECDPSLAIINGVCACGTQGYEPCQDGSCFGSAHLNWSPSRSAHVCDSDCGRLSSNGIPEPACRQRYYFSDGSGRWSYRFYCYGNTQLASQGISAPDACICVRSTSSETEGDTSDSSGLCISNRPPGSYIDDPDVD